MTFVSHPVVGAIPLAAAAAAAAAAVIDQLSEPALVTAVPAMHMALPDYLRK